MATTLLDGLTADLLPAGADLDLIVTSRQDTTLATVREWSSRALFHYGLIAQDFPRNCGVGDYKLVIYLLIQTDGRHFATMPRVFAPFVRCGSSRHWMFTCSISIWSWLSCCVAQANGARCGRARSEPVWNIYQRNMEVRHYLP